MTYNSSDFCTWCNERLSDVCTACIAEYDERARSQGAAVAFGLMGMAEAIRDNAPRVVTRSYWTSETGTQYYDCNCPLCGVLLKKRTPGLHEGTDLEYCGVCRDSI